MIRYVHVQRFNQLYMFACLFVYHVTEINIILLYIYLHIITHSYKYGVCIACSTRIVWVLQFVTLHLPLLFRGRLRMAMFGISGWSDQIKICFFGVTQSNKDLDKTNSFQIWQILLSAILNLIYVVLKLFTRLHEDHKKKVPWKVAVQGNGHIFRGELAVSFRYNIYIYMRGDYRNYSNMSRWNFQASRGFEEIGSGTHQILQDGPIRSLYMELLYSPL